MNCCQLCKLHSRAYDSGPSLSNKCMLVLTESFCLITGNCLGELHDRLELLKSARTRCTTVGNVNPLRNVFVLPHGGSILRAVACCCSCMGQARFQTRARVTVRGLKWEPNLRSDCAQHCVTFLAFELAYNFERSRCYPVSFGGIEFAVGRLCRPVSACDVPQAWLCVSFHCNLPHS